MVQFMPLYYAPSSAPLQYSLQGEPWPLATNAYTLLVTMRTEASGSVKIDRDPDVSPLVVIEPLTPEDAKRGAEAVEAAMRLGSALPSQGRVQHVQDWSAVYDGRGTCRMGSDPRSSVVDTYLRVHRCSPRSRSQSLLPTRSPLE